MAREIFDDFLLFEFEIIILYHKILCLRLSFFIFIATFDL